MKLNRLFDCERDTEIKGIALDSRKVKKGDMFFCIKGLETDGHKYAEQAVSAGAVAIVHTDDINRIDKIDYIKVKDINSELNRICNIFYNEPSRRLTMFGITGTNGKTTTASIISDIFSEYTPCGYMGTIAVRYGDYSRLPSLTTPDSIEVHQVLNEMTEHGMKAAAIEVSSHGLALGRVSTVDFDYAIFTNLTYDHLDFHKTMKNYFDAKKILFRNMKESGVAVLNADDKISFEELKNCCKCRVVTYGIDNEADYMAKELSLGVDFTKFTLVHDKKEYKIMTNLVAKYNISNLLSGIAAMHQAGMPIEMMIPKFEKISQVDGRMEIVDEGQEFSVLVDYAHTPDGFEKIFQHVENIRKTGSNVYTVFGCAGKRDHDKRAVLGKIAGKYSDLVIVTEEDPRNESKEEIAEQILEGIQESQGRYELILDRYEAIKKGILKAKKDDIVLILGKGAEEYMYRGEGREPWMGDVEAAKKVLEKLQHTVL